MPTAERPPGPRCPRPQDRLQDRRHSTACLPAAAQGRASSPHTPRTFFFRLPPPSAPPPPPLALSSTAMPSSANTASNSSNSFFFSSCTQKTRFSGVSGGVARAGALPLRWAVAVPAALLLTASAAAAGPQPAWRRSQLMWVLAFLDSVFSGSGGLRVAAGAGLARSAAAHRAGGAVGLGSRVGEWPKANRCLGGRTGGSAGQGGAGRAGRAVLLWNRRGEAGGGQRRREVVASGGGGAAPPHLQACPPPPPPPPPPAHRRHRGV
jgi:hypothetical protein